MICFKDDTKLQVAKKQSTLERFCYTNGYEIAGTDFGRLGVKIALSHPVEGTTAMMLPPEEVKELVDWLTGTIEQQKDT